MLASPENVNSRSHHRDPIPLAPQSQLVHSPPSKLSTDFHSPLGKQFHDGFVTTHSNIFAHFPFRLSECVCVSLHLWGSFIPSFQANGHQKTIDIEPMHNNKSNPLNVHIHKLTWMANRLPSFLESNVCTHTQTEEGNDVFVHLMHSDTSDVIAKQVKMARRQVTIRKWRSLCIVYLVCLLQCLCWFVLAIICTWKKHLKIAATQHNTAHRTLQQHLWQFPPLLTNHINAFQMDVAKKFGSIRAVAAKAVKMARYTRALMR